MSTDIRNDLVAGLKTTSAGLKSLAKTVSDYAGDLDNDVTKLSADILANPVPASPKLVVVPPPPAPTTNMKAADWQDRYGVATSGGTFKFDADGLTFGPKPIGTGSSTSAALAIFKPAGIAKTFGSMVAEFEFTLKQQLRLPSGNLWETFWLFTNYADNPDFTKICNAFVFKPNHLQIETCSGHVQETWLYEGGPGCPVGVRQKAKVQIVGQTMTVWMNGVQVLVKTMTGEACTSVKDDGRTMTTAPGWLYSSAGAIGLYNEDAVVTVHNFTVTAV